MCQKMGFTQMAGLTSRAPRAPPRDAQVCLRPHQVMTLLYWGKIPVDSGAEIRDVGKGGLRDEKREISIH